MPRRLSKRERKRVHRFALANWKVLLVIFLIIAILCVVAYYCGWFELLKNYFNKDDEPTMSTAGGHETVVSEFGDLQINFLDIGQGDCIVIELPDGKNMIIDSGDDNADQSVIADFATANNIESFDYLLLTHQDSDHVGNMDWVLEEYSVKYIFRPNNYSKNDASANLPEEFNPVISDSDAVSTTKAYADFMVAAYNEQCTVEIFNKDSDFTNLMICGEEKMSYTFNFLTPTASRNEIIYSNKNDYSPVLMLEYAGKRIMFTGDAELDVLDEYIENYDDDFNVDVLKAGHHGSSNATTAEFVSKVDPEYAVIQCGLGNSYGHPHKSVLDAFAGHDGGVTVYRNDTNGTITLSVDKVGNMSWNFENDDMSNNGLTGDQLKQITLSSFRTKVVMDEINSIWKECFYSYENKEKWLIV